ncbi:ABC transporter substrate-binding protein [Vulgatibacter sp.]|uniref:ABC transporter substrate-binding protein n=1 Tax=Vulgatibacter sp. TaxID=1971226 RepID=UPI0035681C9A
MIRRLPLAATLLLLATAAGAGVRPRYGGTVTAALPQQRIDPDPAGADTVAELFVASLLHQPLLRRTADGALAPVLLAEVPRSNDGGRRFHLLLREGLRFHDGRPIRATDLAASLRRLDGGPWAALVLAVERITPRSEHEVEVHLAFPYPRWPEALAEVAASVVPANFTTDAPLGAGPFRLAAPHRLEAFAGHVDGRPFIDAVHLQPQPDRRAAGRLVGAGRAELGPVRGEGAPLATWIFVHPSLGMDVAGAVDRTDLVRWFVPGAAAPFDRLLPSPHHAPAPAAAQGTKTPPGPVALLYDPAVEGHRQVAERIQLRLHDRGVRVQLDPLGEVRERAAAGTFQLALVQLPLPADPGLAAASLLHAAGRGGDARRLLAQVGKAGSGKDEAARATASALAGVRGILPLYAGTERVLPASGTRIQRGGPDLAESWLLPEPEDAP